MDEETDLLTHLTLDGFKDLKKKHLVELGDRYDLRLNISMAKKKLQCYVMTQLVDDDYFESEAVKDKYPPLYREEVDLERERTRARSREREREREKQREFEGNREEIEARKLRHQESESEKQRLHEIEMAKINQLNALEKIDKEHEIKKKLIPGRDKFLMPVFSEDDVEGFFMQFEKVAKQAEWPQNQWTMMVQAVLSGRAQLVYANLSEDDSFNYQVVKQEVLKVYELVPESYRQKFRSLKKGDSQSHLDFAREKSKMFERWCSSKGVNSAFEALKELILVEEFKWKVHETVRCHLNEREVCTLSEAAKIADEYALTHKKQLTNPSSTRQGYQKQSNVGGGNSWGNKVAGKSGHGINSGQSESKGPAKSEDVTCNYCKGHGHMVPNCPVLERKRKKEQDADQQMVKPQALVTVLGRRSRGGLKSTILKSNPPMIGIEKSSALMAGNCSQLNAATLQKPSPLVTGKSSQLNTDTICKRPSPLITSACSFDSAAVDNHDSEKSNPFVSWGKVSINGSEFFSIPILRDTGASQSLLLSSVFDPSDIPDTDDFILCKGLGGATVSVPLHSVHLQSDLVRGHVTVGLIPDDGMPMKGISLLLGNDLAGGRVVPGVELTSTPILEQSCDDDIYPSCVVTRNMSRLGTSDDNKNRESGSMAESEDLPITESASNIVDLADTVFTKLVGGGDDTTYSRTQLIELQKQDDELMGLRKEALSESESKNVPRGYYVKDDVLMRKYRPPNVSPADDWAVIHQVVVPKAYRKEIMSMAHDLPVSGHLGIKKTTDRILQQFFWPGMNDEIKQYCKSCHTCQKVGKYQSDPPVAPLQPIPVIGEPFSQVVIDCVGPLPKTRSGNEYILTIMCTATRFPEGIPVRNIKTKTISKVLLKFFTTFGLPKEIQSDQGSNFTAREFKQMMDSLGIKHKLSSAYHPESQGVLERFHSTLKTMMKAFCLEHTEDWDEGVPLLLFAARDVAQESLGYSPFEMVFGHRVRGPLSLLSAQWINSDVNINILDYVVKFKERLHETWAWAGKHLAATQDRMKTWYDRNARSRVFEPGEQVLVLFPVQTNPLQARFHGPYEVEKRIGDLNYLVRTPDRKKRNQLCHVNMLKRYVDRDAEAKVAVGLVTKVEENDVDGSENTTTGLPPNCKLSNSEVLRKLDQKLNHLNSYQQEQLKQMLLEYKAVFPDVPVRTTAATHDVDVGDTQPIKQHAFRVSPDKRDLTNQEVKYMLDHDIIRPSTSSWSSPCVLVPKPDGSVRFCTDYRKLNTVTKTDVYPIPRIDDCIDRVGDARYLSKIDLLKGYWCVPLTERGREVSAFVCSAGLFEYNVMPFGMKNAPATFQRMMEKVLSGLSHSYAYIDDVVIRSDTWEEHVDNIREVLCRLADARLTVNLAKSEFACAKVSYLGYQIGQGQLAPVEAKVKVILDFAPPTDKKAVRRFLGMIGYYRKFCKNFAQLAIPLTGLLRKDGRFNWTDECKEAFERLKHILCHHPVLKMPDFNASFELAIDASDQAAGGVLLQTDGKTESIKHPIAYFSRKFDKHQQNYSTIEKELLALILAVQHFEVYISRVKLLKVYTDHNPLVFLKRMKNRNRRLLNWSLLLQEYNLDIHHIKGTDNVIADALSRC